MPGCAVFAFQNQTKTWLIFLNQQSRQKDQERVARKSTTATRCGEWLIFNGRETSTIVGISQSTIPMQYGVVTASQNVTRNKSPKFSPGLLSFWQYKV